MTAHLRLWRLILALLFLAAGPADAALAADPPRSHQLPAATVEACQTDPLGAACITRALAGINLARAAEGVGPMRLPGNFVMLSIPQQLLVLANLERRDRGFTVLVLGLAADLNHNALNGARRDADPQPSPWNGNSMSANWAGGYRSALEADYGWMYDDGVGSPNIDCSALRSAGCWGHRHDILMAFDPPLMMGAAVARGAYGTSMAELFVGGDAAAAPGRADAPLAPTYVQIIQRARRGRLGASRVQSPRRR